uniref:Zinc metalloproteinase YIL108W n=1 Tax=Trichobilharzia regenti TaxID=157069 RepID=A0AA85JYR3_TRIRE|nr:unnamed protein product [Trichobilharzia regenti]
MFNLSNAYDLLLVNYPLFQLKGNINPYCGCPSILVSVHNVHKNGWETSWSLCESMFKVFVPLSPGCNTLQLKCKHHLAEFRIVCVHNHNSSFIVRPIYVICSDDTGEFQAPEGVVSTKENACKRIGLGIRLLQTLTAEAFFSELGKRYTFMTRENLVEELSPDFLQASHVSCMCHYSSLSKTFVSNSTPEEVWKQLAYELYKTYPDNFNRTKWIAFMACTRYHPMNKSSTESLSYDEILNRTTAHFALGTGGLALLGTGTLHAWPESIEDLQSVMQDTRLIDTTLMDDTAYRHTFWAAFSTGLGAVWHELGHCFGLEHYPHGIMFRGDDINLCLGFPPPDSMCPHELRTNGEVIQGLCQPKNQAINSLCGRVLCQFKPPTSVPGIMQFHRITQFVPVKSTSHSLDHFNNGEEKNSKQWGFCSSLWHQGSAFWGSEALSKLISSPWITEASSEGKTRC